MTNYFSRLTLWLGLCVSFMLSACQEDTQDLPAPTPESDRTVLFYMMTDHNLHDAIIHSLNLLEAGWNENINGNLLVYLDPSPNQNQFHTPTLLKVVHDTSDSIKSEVIKVYPDQDPADSTVMRKVLEDAIMLYPAKSHGLIIGTHGSAWFPSELADSVEDGHEHDTIPTQLQSVQKSTRGLFGADRYGNNIEINELARILPVKYDFLVFHACKMGNVETAYELRNKCSAIVACELPLPAIGLPYDQNIKYLFTTPRADLQRFANESKKYYHKISMIVSNNFNISVIHTDKLENLASATQSIMDKLSQDTTTYLHKLNNEILPITEDSLLFDLKQIVEIGCKNNPILETEYKNFTTALQAAVPCYYNVTIEVTPGVASPTDFCGLSCYLPLLNPKYRNLNDFYLKNYKWGYASGFDLQPDNSKIQP